MAAIGPIPSSLKRLRAVRGLTQQEVADAACISRVAYRSIETGASEPRVETLIAICDALSARLEDLLVSRPPLSHVRFRAQKKLKRREHVLVEVGRLLHDYSDLEDLLDAGPQVAFDVRRSQKKRKHSIAYAKHAAAAARAAAGLGESESIRDICGLLEDHGVKVIPVSLSSDKFDGFFGLSVGPQDRGPAIAVNVWERISVERWIFSAAHELGHLLMHLGGSFDVAQTDEDPDEEREADAFASHFLMPHEVFVKEWREARGLSLIDRVMKVKRIFGVSYATVLHRIGETEPIGRGIWPRFFGTYKRQFGKSLPRKQEPVPAVREHFAAGMPEPRSSGEPDRLLASDFRTDRLARLVRRAIEEEKITRSRGAEILGLSASEMRNRAASWIS